MPLLHEIKAHFFPPPIDVSPFNYHPESWSHIWDVPLNQLRLTKGDIFPVNHFLVEAFIQSQGSAAQLGIGLVSADIAILYTLEDPEVYQQLVSLHQAIHPQSSRHNHVSHYQDKAYLIEVLINACERIQPRVAPHTRDLNQKSQLFRKIARCVRQNNLG